MQEKIKIATKLIVGAVITIILLYFLMRNIGIEDLHLAFEKVTVPVFFGAFLLPLIHYFFRTLRIRMFTHNKLSFYKMFLITNIHNMLVQLLPMKLGELSFFYLTKKEGDIPLSESVSALTVARLFDGIMLIAFFLLSMAFTRFTSTSLIAMKLYFIFLLLGMFIAFVICLFFYNPIIKFLELQKETKKAKSIQLMFIEKILRLFIAFKAIMTREKIALGLLYSLGVIVSYYIFFSFFLYAFGFEITYWDMILLPSLISLLSFIPIQGIAGFGNVEAVWSLVLVAYGIPAAQAISAIFVLHVISLVCYCVTGIGSYILLKVTAKFSKENFAYTKKS